MGGRLVRRSWVWNPGIYAPSSFRRSCGYDAFIPDDLADLHLNLTGDVAGVVADAERAIVRLNRSAGPELAPLARLLLRSESIASSKVEGMQVDARTLARAEANQDAGRRVGPESAEILANIDAMQLAIARASTSDPITPADILAIHAALMARGSAANMAGRIRTTQNWIGGNDYNPCGADFVPPPHDELVRLLDDLARFCNQENLPTLIQAAVAHAQFETIHPFEDGNGRTGRAVVQIVLRRRGLAPSFVPPVSIVLARHRDRYIGGLDAFREDRIGDWLEMFAVATRQATDLAAAYTQRVSELQDRWRERLRHASNPRADAAAWAVMDILPAHPVITVPVGVAATRRTKPAVTNALAELQAAGVLERLGESTRNRGWEAEGLLDLIVALEAGVGA